MLTANAKAAPLRVTTWNLEPNLAAGTNGISPGYRKNLIQEAAEVLTKLHPDVILLQGVPDWESCNSLVKQLKPANYTVAAWSSFRDPQTGTLSSRQTAILSKTRAYISWSEAWKSDATAAAPGGFAFAAIRTGGRNAAFYSAQLGANALLGAEGRSEEQQSARAESVRQLLAQIDSLKKWTTNRIQVLTVAGDFNTSRDDATLASEKTLSLLQSIGLVDTFTDVPLSQRITLPSGSRHTDATADYIFTRDAKAIATPEIIPTALTEHYPVTCDVDLNPPAPLPITPAQPAPVQVAQAANVKPPETKTNATTNAAPVVQATAPPAAPPQKNDNWRIAAIAVGGILLLAIIWKLTRPRRVQPKRPVLLTMNNAENMSGLSSVTPERIVITPRPADTTGSAADNPPIVHIEIPGAAQVQAWQRRVEEAERRAQRATELARQGLMSHLSEWLKTKLVQRLASDRARLLETQKAAAQKMLIVDERLAKIEGQLQERYRTYEKRIDELEKELNEAREENRELIRAKIALVKAELEKARAEAARSSGEKRHE